MQDLVSIVLAKMARLVLSTFGLGAGGTWPGEIALTVSPHMLSGLCNQLKEGIIIVAGTNGKTTTTLMIKKILESSGKHVIHNATGANLLNGVVSAMIQKANWKGKIQADWGVFEVDENSLSGVISFLSERSESKDAHNGEPSTSSGKKLIIVLLNLFRDQLDRYGEVDVIAEKWEKALRDIGPQSSDFGQFENITLIVNADDPLIAHLGKGWNIYSSSEPKASREATAKNKDGLRLRSDNNVIYFGVNDKKHFLQQKEHATDSTFCLNCGGRLDYSGIFYSHIGIWKCFRCGEKRPTPDVTGWDSPLPGLYNVYNTLAAVSVGKTLSILDKEIKQSLEGFTPAFGRQEEFTVDGKNIKLFLSKNPAGYNVSLRTVLELMQQRHPRLDRGSTKNMDSRVRGNDNVLLLALNDRIPDGRDVSWIWDVDFEVIPETVSVIVSGDRVYDMTLRVKYSKKSQIRNHKSETNSKIQNFLIEPKLEDAITAGLEKVSIGGTLYVLPTYSAMLEVRKILTGRKIL